MICCKFARGLPKFITLLAMIKSLATCQSVEPKTRELDRPQDGRNRDGSGPGKPQLLMTFQLSQSPHSPALAPPPPPEDQACKAASDCLGNQGCCLRGRCSKTGGMFDQCYTQEPMNGQAPSQGVWNDSDLCPCGYGYHCLALTAGDSHRLHGPRGFCMPVVG